MFTNRFLTFGRQILSRNIIQNCLQSSRPSLAANYAQNIVPANVELMKPVDNRAECKEVINTVNNILEENRQGRVFAIVHLCGKQFKVTAGDLVLVEGYWQPTIGDQIKLEKVLLAGSDDFTLVGRPLLHDGLVDVYATVIEKSISHTRLRFKKKRRKQYNNHRFHRPALSMIRINSVEINNRIDAPAPKSDKEIRLFD